VTRDEVHESCRRFARPDEFSLAALGPAVGEPLGEADWPVGPAG
jgi:hypothetical protein